MNHSGMWIEECFHRGTQQFSDIISLCFLTSYARTTKSKTNRHVCKGRKPFGLFMGEEGQKLLMLLTSGSQGRIRTGCPLV